MKKITNEKLANINAGFNNDFWNGYCWVPDQLGNWVGVATSIFGKQLTSAIGGTILSGFGGGLAVAQLVCQYVKH